MLSRREILRTASCGFGSLALANLVCQQAARAVDSPLAVKKPHFEPLAKRVIFMFMQGAPSHMDTFDYKPGLERDDGKQFRGGKLMKSPFKFEHHGKSGLPISNIFPELAKHADDLCLINGMQTDVPNHPQATIQMHTGSFQFVRPSLGSWVLYGLGTENQELPGFITINPAGAANSAQNYGSAFLPAPFQGTKIGGNNQQLAQARIANIGNPRVAQEAQRLQLDLVQSFNKERLEEDKANNELEGVIESYELAFRMQGAIPRVMDITDESSAIQQSYGIGDRQTDNFGRQCLLARRFAEEGVRFIELGTGGWDQHNNLKGALTRNAVGIDKPMAGLIADLKQRGLWKDTLLVWGGEFGRTSATRNGDGRDHNGRGFSMWMAGGPVKGGIRYGATDEHGDEAVEDKMHLHDLHATILHILGLNHEQLTYRYSGRDFRLTETSGVVAKKILA